MTIHMNDDRKIRIQGKDLGTFSIDQLYRMAMEGEINHTAKYWSGKKSAWRPLAGIVVDMYPSRLDQMRRSGFTKVKFLGCKSEDCPACMALQERAYPIDEAPKLPPTDCTCVPWCRCVEIADESCL